MLQRLFHLTANGWVKATHGSFYQLNFKISALASKLANLWVSKRSPPSTVKQLSTKSWFSIKKENIPWIRNNFIEEGMKINMVGSEGLLGK